MADDKKNDVLTDRLNALEAKLDAQAEILAATPSSAPTETVTNKPSKAAVLTGETFSVGGADYKVKYPVIHHAGKNISEADILADKDLQKELVKGGFGVIQKVAAMLLLFFFAFTFSAQATSVTINAHSAEVLTTTTRSLYQLQDLLIIYRASTDAFEMQTAETRSKLWGGDVDSVTISGASTTAAKLAFLRTLMLETTTTGGYRCFIGRNNIEFYYNTSTNRLDLKYSKNKQPLWFGSTDSLQSGPSGSAAKIAYLRLINRWRAQDCLPTTSVATIAAGAAAGTSPTVSVTGDAFSGLISVTTGTSATTGTLATVTLKITAPTGTRISIDPVGANACLHSVRWYAAGTTTTLVLTVPATALSDATAYTWNYAVVPY